ncbi:hypothetical protein TNCV_2781411 [Trichonephila clavipes]|nr:hypothetical protein TNCV_2781411 [Trichonephila clavipes]
MRLDCYSYVVTSRTSGLVVSNADCCAVWPGSFREVGERGRAVGGLEVFQGILHQNWGVTELNGTVTYMVLKTTANDMRTSSALT